jgi:hypothetical protein
MPALSLLALKSWFGLGNDGGWRHVAALENG